MSFRELEVQKWRLIGHYYHELFTTLLKLEVGGSLAKFIKIAKG